MKLKHGLGPVMPWSQETKTVYSDVVKTSSGKTKTKTLSLETKIETKTSTVQDQDQHHKYQDLDQDRHWQNWDQDQYHKYQDKDQDHIKLVGSDLETETGVLRTTSWRVILHPHGAKRPPKMSS